MAISKIILNGEVQMDVTSDTVQADKLMQGYTAHDRKGALITGTATGGSITPVAVTVTTSRSGDRIMGPTYDPDNQVIGTTFSTGSWTASGFMFYILYDQACADATGVLIQYVSSNSGLIITPENNVEVGVAITSENCTIYNIYILGDNAAFHVHALA